MSASKKALMNFTTMMQTDVPQGRNGKHKEIVTRILADLNQIDDGTDFLSGVGESDELVVGCLDLDDGAVDNFAGLLDLLADLCGRAQHLAGRDGGVLHIGRG